MPIFLTTNTNNETYVRRMAAHLWSTLFSSKQVTIKTNQGSNNFSIIVHNTIILTKQAGDFLVDGIFKFLEQNNIKCYTFIAFNFVQNNENLSSDSVYDMSITFS